MIRHNEDNGVSLYNSGQVTVLKHTLMTPKGKTS